MNRVIAIVEGQTEQTFVRDVLAPQLAQQGIMMTARRIGKPGHKGGIGRYERAHRDILTILRENPASYCTTMFDYYGMPNDWPGRVHPREMPYLQKALLIQQSLTEDIAQRMGSSFQPERFIPYVQMHEFEALLFSEPKILAQTVQQAGVASKLQEIVAQVDSPEMINDNPETAPSKRLVKLFPAYEKTLHGTIVAQRMGLPVMREKCPHFAAWVARLEGLPAA